MTVERRTVINSIDGRTQTIEGDPNTSFREACTPIAPVDIEWTILNQDGEDISELPLKDYKGKAQIAPADVSGG